MCRKKFKLKMRLTPYIYTSCHEANQTGTPTVRGMVLEFPQDPVTFDIYPEGNTEYELNGKKLKT